LTKLESSKKDNIMGEEEEISGSKTPKNVSKSKLQRILTVLKTAYF